MRNKFRVYLLSLLFLIDTFTPRLANAEVSISNTDSGSLKDKVNQLKCVSNVHSELLTQIQQQIIDNQHDIDFLRGQIQKNQYQLSQVVKRQRYICQETGNFFSQEPAASSDNKSQVFSSTCSPQSMELGSDTTLSCSGVNTDYSKAVVLVLKKKLYNQAISAFQNFLKCHPNSIYHPNANYWLGQLNYNQGKKDNAAYYFALVVKRYPKSSKAPDALLKIGIIMQEKGQKDKARSVYYQVGKLYPSAEAAKQAQKRISRL